MYLIPSLIEMELLSNFIANLSGLRYGTQNKAFTDKTCKLVFNHVGDRPHSCNHRYAIFFQSGETSLEY